MQKCLDARQPDNPKPENTGFPRSRHSNETDRSRCSHFFYIRSLDAVAKTAAGAAAEQGGAARKDSRLGGNRG
jgi:hypothetical protein